MIYLNHLSEINIYDRICLYYATNLENYLVWLLSRAIVKYSGYMMELNVYVAKIHGPYKFYHNIYSENQKTKRAT